METTEKELREYIARHKAKTGVRPTAMPVTPHEEATLRYNMYLPSIGATRMSMTEDDLLAPERVLDFEGVELFIAHDAKEQREAV